MIDLAWGKCLREKGNRLNIASYTPTVSYDSTFNCCCHGNIRTSIKTMMKLMDLVRISTLLFDLTHMVVIN